jgi:alpha-N-arabinofuranosidase
MKSLPPSTFRSLPVLALLCVLPALGADAPAGGQTARLMLKTEEAKTKIDRNIYGHFSEHLGRCVYEGYWVEEDSSIPNTKGIRNDVVEALKKIKVPVLRWPGGCFADEYHWKDGIGPRDKRPSMVNTHWGKVVENNHFGTHEFLELCKLLECEPYICGNVGSGTVQEMQEWVEYMTFDGQSPMANLRAANGQATPWKVKYFGVGNENWGCGGNMTPEYYSDQYRRYATYVRNFGGNRIYKIACGANAWDYRWTDVVMKEAGGQMDGLSLHYYCGTGKKSRSATRFDEEDWFYLLKNALRMEELLTKHSEIMDKYDPNKRVGMMVDEWGTWHQVEPGSNPGFLYQQSTLRDALVAGLSLNILNQHCDRVRMANIAQTVNVLQSMILTDKEKMVLTPTYHVYEMYTVHHDATLIPAEVTSAQYTFGAESIPAVNVSASKDKTGKVHVTLCNLDPNQSVAVACELAGAGSKKVSGRVLTAATMQTHNTFEKPAEIQPVGFTGFSAKENELNVALPAKSVVVLALE